MTQNIKTTDRSVRTDSSTAPREDGSPSASRADTPSIGRRSLLAAAGGAATVALAGCIGGAETPSETPSPTPSDGGPLDGDEIDPQFGYVGRTLDAPTPVEPDHEIQLLVGERQGAPVPEFYFAPTGLYVEAGAVVKFVLATPDHTVTAYHPALGRTQRVPDGVPPISSPVLGAGTYWLYEFETPGVYDLYCAPHEPFGMAVRLVVGEASGPGVDGTTRTRRPPPTLPDRCDRPRGPGDGPRSDRGGGSGRVG